MSSPSNPEGSRRLFLALWPEQAIRQQIAALAASAAGRRRVRDDNLHLTLVFLGATPAERLIAYQTALTDLPVPALDLVLDRYGYWRQPRILWLGCRETPPPLQALVADLHQRLRACGFIPERRAFQPHITLARQFAGPIPTYPSAAPLRWPVGKVALVESILEQTGVRYQVLKYWPSASTVTACCTQTA